MTARLLPIFLAALSTTAVASETAVNWHRARGAADLAVDGYDVVAYFEEGRARLGDPAFESRHDGLVYRFASQENLGRFAADPERYEPAFGGWCALAMGVDPEKYGFGQSRFPADAESFLVVGDRLLLFARLPGFDARALFERDPDRDRLLARADVFWAKRERLAAELGEPPPGMNPRAPMETARFAFLIGRWENQVLTMRDTETREYGPPVEGIWAADWASEGFAIQDEWRSVATQGFGGPTIRSFDPASRSWTMVYVPVNSPRRAVWVMEASFDEKGELHGEFEGVDAQGRPFVTRVHFTDIRKDRFRWSADRSLDGGETWTLDFMVAETHRIQ
jgi:hypothetical protein